MTLSMHQASVPVFVQGLKGLKGVLTKAAAQAEAKGWDADALLKARLYPDMFPFKRQVQIATDFAKGSVSRLAGIEPPPYDDVETSFAELVARVDATAAAELCELDGRLWHTRPVPVGRAHVAHLAMAGDPAHVSFKRLSRQALERGSPLDGRAASDVKIGAVL